MTDPEDTVLVDASGKVASIVKSAAVKRKSNGTFEFGIAQIVQNATSLALSSQPAVIIGAPGYAPTQITPEITEALKQLPEIFGQVNPDTPRILTRDELLKLASERRTISTLVAVLNKRKDEEIREITSTHLDLVEERDRGARRADLVDDDGRVVSTASELDARGHYAIKSEVPLPEIGMKINRTVTRRSAEISAARLKEAEEEGRITHEDYLALTSQVRVFDPEKARSRMAKLPLETIKVLREALVPGSVTTSILFPDV